MMFPTSVIPVELHHSAERPELQVSLSLVINNNADLTYEWVVTAVSDLQSDGLGPYLRRCR